MILINPSLDWLIKLVLLDWCGARAVSKSSETIIVVPITTANMPLAKDNVTISPKKKTARRDPMIGDPPPRAVARPTPISATPR
jgi:hypothetical protein